MCSYAKSIRTKIFVLKKLNEKLNEKLNTKPNAKGSNLPVYPDGLVCLKALLSEEQHSSGGLLDEKRLESRQTLSE